MLLWYVNHISPALFFSKIAKTSISILKWWREWDISGFPGWKEGSGMNRWMNRAVKLLCITLQWYYMSLYICPNHQEWTLIEPVDSGRLWCVSVGSSGVRNVPLWWGCWEWGGYSCAVIWKISIPFSFAVTLKLLKNK